MTRTTYGVGLASATRRMLTALGDTVEIETSVDTIDAYTAAITLAATYRLEPWPLLDALREAYGADEIPVAHLEPLAGMLEGRLGGYEETTEHEEVELAIVKPEGFDAVEVDGVLVRQAEISYPADRAHLVFGPERFARENPAGYGFHYTPYNFDSAPEADFYERVLRALNVRPDEVREICFTGAITDPKKTDLTFSYRGADGRDHRYTPDFVIHARGDRWMLVEVKMTARRHDEVEGELGVKARAMAALQAANPGRIFYRMVFADAVVSGPDLAAVANFVDANPSIGS